MTITWRRCHRERRGTPPHHRGCPRPPQRGRHEHGESAGDAPTRRRSTAPCRRLGPVRPRADQTPWKPDFTIAAGSERPTSCFHPRHFEGPRVRPHGPGRIAIPALRATPCRANKTLAQAPERRGRPALPSKVSLTPGVQSTAGMRRGDCAAAVSRADAQPKASSRFPEIQNTGAPAARRSHRRAGRPHVAGHRECQYRARGA